MSNSDTNTQDESRRPKIKYVDSPPEPGWFILDIMRKEARKWDWSALMVDVDPDDLKNCICDFPALFYVHPKEYRPAGRAVRQCFVSIPGKHRNRDAAWTALEDMMEARH